MNVSNSILRWIIAVTVSFVVGSQAFAQQPVPEQDKYLAPAKAAGIPIDVYMQNVVDGVNFNFPRADFGPNLDDPRERMFLDLYKRYANMGDMSRAMKIPTPSYRRGLKFREDFGLMPQRGPMIRNMIQIFATGQDPTHIAEFAGHPGIAGFGGRVQDMAMHFGVFDGIFFNNLYTHTISGQYGVRSTPMIYKDSKGKTKYMYKGLIDNRLYMLTYESVYTEVHFRAMAHAIEQNQDSAKLWMLLGNAGRDFGAAFVNWAGGKVPAYTSDATAKRYNVPLFKIVSAGGNNEYAVPVDKNNKDIAEVLLSEASGKKVRLNYANESDQKRAKEVIEANLARAEKMMVFTNAGPLQNGLISTNQLGYDLSKMEVNGVRTQSIKGLKLPSINGGYFEAPDMVLTHSPHPTAISMAQQEDPSRPKEMVKKKMLDPLEKEKARGWIPPVAERNFVSSFIQGLDYNYGRTNIPSSHGDPGVSELKLKDKSTASRAGRKVIVAGTRDRGVTWGPKGTLKEMQAETSFYDISQGGRPKNSRPLLDEQIYDYDWKLRDDHVMQDLLYVKHQKVLSELQKPRRGKTWTKHGVGQYWVMQDSKVGATGHYRGDLRTPRVLIMHDPHKYNAIDTAKAASGDRGQRIHGMMEDLGVGNKYAVLNTVPFFMDGATEAEWSEVLEKTKEYRTDLVEELLNRNTPELILADGPKAVIEMKRIMAMYNHNIPIVNIQRGRTSNYGLAGAAKQINRVLGTSIKFRMHRSDIPRAHLSYNARVAAGNGGEAIAGSNAKKYKGRAFALVARDEITDRSDVELTDVERQSLREMKTKLERYGDILPDEKIEDYIARRKAFVTEWETKSKRTAKATKAAKAKRTEAEKFVSNVLGTNEKRFANKCVGIFK